LYEKVAQNFLVKLTRELKNAQFFYLKRYPHFLHEIAGQIIPWLEFSGMYNPP
jgi:hypothetical protein